MKMMLRLYDPDDKDPGDVDSSRTASSIAGDVDHHHGSTDISVTSVMETIKVSLIQPATVPRMITSLLQQFLLSHIL